MTTTTTTTTTLLPENTVVGDLGADDATDNSSAVHSHTQLKSGTRLMLHNEKVMDQMFSAKSV